MHIYYFCRPTNVGFVKPKQILAVLMCTQNNINKGPSRHFQLNPILILEFDIGVRIIFLMDILKDNV